MSVQRFYPALIFFVAASLACLSYATSYTEWPWPHRYTQGDDLIYLEFAKNFAESWNVYSYKRLAAPFEYAAQDFPFFTFANLIIIAIFNIFTQNIYHATLFFHLFCIGLSAALMYVFLDRYGVHRAISMLAGLSFGITPYILTRNVGHLDYAVGVLFPMLLLILQSAIRVEQGLDKSSRWALLWAFLFGGLAVLQQFYYAFFIMVFLGGLAVLWLIPKRSIWTLKVIAMIGLGVVISFAYFVYLFNWNTTQDLGRNLTYTQRTLASLNYFSLVPSHLVLPQEYHRWGIFTSVKQNFHALFSVEGKSIDPWTHSLGFFGVVGFLYLSARAITPFRSERPFPTSGPEMVMQRSTMLTFLSVMTLSSVFYGISGGGAALFGYFVTPQMHGSQRISLPIACFAVAGTAFLLQSLYERWTARPRVTGLSRAISTDQLVWLGAIVVGFLVYKDQTIDFRRKHYFSPEVQTAPQRIVTDQAFFAAVEAKLPKGAAVYIYPHAPWSGVMPWENMNLKPVINTNNLNWSAQPPYARQGHNWSVELAQLDFEGQMARLREKGFAAVMVNTKTFEVGRAHPHLAYKLALPDFLKALGEKAVEAPMISPDGQYQVFLMPDHQTLELKRNCEPYALGTRVGTTFADKNFRYFDIGWAIPIPEGAWMARQNGFPAFLRVCPDKPVTKDIELEVEMTTNVHPASPTLDMEIIVNRTSLMRTVYKSGETPARSVVKVTIPAALASRKQTIDIGFKYFRGGAHDLGPGSIGAQINSFTLREVN